MATLLRCLGLIVTALAPNLSVASNHDRPNILFCIADDWGWPHAGAYGSLLSKTAQNRR